MRTVKKRSVLSICLTSHSDIILKERLAAISKQLKADKEKLQKIRLLLARKNREIALLQRKIDEVPSRTELTQYQRRFIELYGQGVSVCVCVCITKKIPFQLFITST